jgi:hypothetical protein
LLAGVAAPTEVDAAAALSTTSPEASSAPSTSDSAADASASASASTASRDSAIFAAQPANKDNFEKDFFLFQSLTMEAEAVSETLKINAIRTRLTA